MLACAGTRGGGIRPIDDPFHPSMYVGLNMSVWKLPVTVFKLLTQDSVHIIQVHLRKMIFLFFRISNFKGHFCPLFPLKTFKNGPPSTRLMHYLSKNGFFIAAVGMQRDTSYFFSHFSIYPFDFFF